MVGVVVQTIEVICFVCVGNCCFDVFPCGGVVVAIKTVLLFAVLYC